RTPTSGRWRRGWRTSTGSPPPGCATPARWWCAPPPPPSPPRRSTHTSASSARGGCSGRVVVISIPRFGSSGAGSIPVHPPSRSSDAAPARAGFLSLTSTQTVRERAAMPPSMLHEGLLLLFQNRPMLAPELLRDVLGVTLPAFTEARVDSAELTEVVP